MQMNELSVNLHCFDSFHVENNRFANKRRDNKLFKFLNHDTKKLSEFPKINDSVLNWDAWFTFHRRD